MRRSTVRLCTLSSVLALVPLVGMSNAAATETTLSINDRVVAAGGQYWNAHPGDYIGLDRAVREAGGDGVWFWLPGVVVTQSAAGADLGTCEHTTIQWQRSSTSCVDQLLTAEQAQAVYDEAMRLSEEPPVGSSLLEPDDGSGWGDRPLPVDTFNVSAAWYHVVDAEGEWWSFSGQWNFKDKFIGSGQPDDASGLATKEWTPACWRQDGDEMYAASYDGQDYTRLTYRKEVDYDSSVWAVRDTTSGFKLLTDHGSHTISYKRTAYGCPQRPYGKYFFEHNQESSCGGWSFTISIKVFSLSYNCPGGQKLQKSTGLVYRP